jgi:hypothetical protein
MSVLVKSFAVGIATSTLTGIFAIIVYVLIARGKAGPFAPGTTIAFDFSHLFSSIGSYVVLVGGFLVGFFLMYRRIAH